jgi:hypothetical protein
LEEPAGFADSQAEWEFRFGLGQVLGTKEIIGEGLKAEVEDEFAIGGMAGAAVELVHC